MSSDNQPPSPGHSSSNDPNFSGAKPAAIRPYDNVWGMFGVRGAPTASAALSEQLARNWWLVLLRGVAAILFGAAALLLPGPTLAALVLLFAAYMLVDGIVALAASLTAARHHERWGALLLEGIADLVASAIAFVWPLATIFAFVIVMAAWAIISGGLLLAAAFRLHISHGRGLMAFGGMVSLIWGILLILSPLVGALVLTWWLGAYALFFGGALIALSFQLRRRRPPDHGRAVPGTA